MKKTVLLTLSAAFTMVPATASMLPSTIRLQANAATSVKMGDMIIWTAMKEGGAYTDFENVDLQVLHGNLEAGTIDRFATYQKDDGWSGSLGTANSDDAYCVHYKLFTRKNDGIIAKITAKKALTVTMAKERGAEWIQSAKFGVYKGTDSNLEAVHASTVMTGDETASDFAVSADLVAGESYYFEFRFQWDDYRNMDPLPSFSIAESVTPPVSSESSSSEIETPSSSEESNSSSPEESSSSEETPISSESEKPSSSSEQASSSSESESSSSSEQTSSSETSSAESESSSGSESSASASSESSESSSSSESISSNASESSESSSAGESSSSSSTSSAPTPSDLTGETSIALPQLAKEEVLLNGDPLTLNGFKIQALQGTFDAGWNKYGNYSLNGDNALLSKAGVFDGREMAAVENWRLKTTNTSFPAFLIEAEKDIKIAVSHPKTQDNCWIDEAGQFFGFYLLSGEDTYTIWSKRITEKVNPANAFGGEMMLKKGDKAIWLFGSTEAYERNVAIVPTFSGDETAFDETIYSSQKKVQTESVAMWDALTKTINSDYQDASYKLFDFGFYYGNVKEMYHFDSHEGDGTGTAEDALWSGVPNSSTGFQRWQFQCSPIADAIMKITAKVDANFTLTHSAIWEDAWSADNSELRFYGLDQDGTLFLKETKTIVTGSKENDFGISLSLRKGEALIIDYATKNDEWYSVNYAPTVTADTSKFAESDTIDFEAARALTSLKTEKINALNDKVNQLEESDYNTRDWGDIQAIMDEAINAIDNATSQEEVNAIAQEALAKIDAVPTAQKLADHKADVTTAIDEYFASLNKDDYSEEDWEKIQSNYEYYKKALASAQTVAEMDKALASFKEKASAIQKVERNNNNAGLWIGIGCAAGALAIGGAIGATLMIKKKRKAK